MPTLKELLEKGESFKYGTDYRKVEADKDTLVEFETQGIRPKFTIRQPLLYGTQTLRITRRSTNILDDMKESRNNQGGSLGLLGGVIGKAKETLGNLASKIGIPEAQIPTRVVDELEGTGNTSEIPETLAKIRKDGQGSLVGKFLKQNAQGTPNQLGRQAIGGALSLAKEKARDAIFGVGGEPDLSPSANDTINTKPTFYGETTYSNLKLYSKEVNKERYREGYGLQFNLRGMQIGSGLTKDFISSKQTYDTNNYANPQSEQVIPSFPSFPEFSISSLTQNIPGKRDKTYLQDSQAASFRIDKSEIGKFNTTSDKVNLYGVWEGDAEGNPTEQIVDNKTIDDLDFIPLRFYSVAKKQGVSFKATVSGITETFSPSWESSNFIGNPYSFYTYQSINRKIDFSFSVYSLSGEEHKKNWEKLDFFSSLVYPQNTTNDVYVTPPLLKLTLGNMYKNKLGFFESLSYTIDDSTPWEIGLGATKTGNRITNIDPLSDLKDYKLPTIITVSVSYQIIETSNDVVGKKLYPYGV